MAQGAKDSRSMGMKDTISQLNHRRVHSPMLCIVQTSTERSEVGANTPLLRSRRQTPLWCLSACTGEVYYRHKQPE